jgi:uncharacterized protein YhaN
LTIEQQRCELKLVDLEEKVSTLNEKLHLPLNEEEVLTINTNIYMKNQVEQVSRKKQRLLEIQQELEEKFLEEKNTLEELETKVRSVQTQTITDTERTRLEAMVNADHEKRTVEIELKAVQDKIEYYHHSNEQEKKAYAKVNKQKQVQFLTIGVLLLILSLYGLYTRQWGLLVIGVTGSILIGVFLSKNLRPKNELTDKGVLGQLLEKEKLLSQKLKAFNQSNIPEIQERLKQDNRVREQLQLLKIKLKQQQTQYEKVLRKFEDLEKEMAEINEHLLKLSGELNIPEYIANTFLLEAFQLIEQYKQVGREKGNLLARLKDIKLEQAGIVDKLSNFSKEYLANQEADLPKIAYLLRNKLKEEQRKLIKNEEKLRKLDDLEADLNQLMQEQAHLILERTKLLNEAGVESEEAFYELGNKVEEKARLIERQNDINKQLRYTFLEEDDLDRFLNIHHTDEWLGKYRNEMDLLSARLSELQEKLAAANYQIQILEEGGSYSELLHNFKQKKFELEEAAKEWASYSLALNILSQTVEKYKSVHLPRMLKKAEEYLSYLTDKHYCRIHLQKSGSGFLIERSDHTLFEANELSQATTEQVYVSIRLALAVTLYEKYQFPIIIDDSFVNFDGNRTQKVMELLTTLKQNQILFFTCHTHLLPFFQTEKVHFLQKRNVEVIS